LMSAYSDESLVARARSGVALAFLPKPFKDMDEVLRLIDQGLQEKKETAQGPVSGKR